MALIVEDGTMPVAANCYIDVAFVDAVAANIGDLAWMALAVADKERLIIYGALVVDDGATYRYSGSPQTATQFMVWPRTGATYETGGPAISPSTIPIQIQRANAAAALNINSGAIALPGSGAQVPSNRYVTQESVGDLSISYGLESGSSITGGASGPYFGLGYSAITGIVAPLLDEVFYDNQSATGSGVASAVAARRGPSMAAPAYGGLWAVGMNDYGEDQKTTDGIN